MRMRFLIALFVIFPFSLQSHSVGLLVMATGKYTRFVGPLLASARQYFCKNHKVTFFIFTDGVIEQADDVVRIEQKRLGWPYDTMMRFAVYQQAAEYFKEQDYLFSCDADMLFVNTVGDEILADLVATQHPGFVGIRGTYETRGSSTACVRAHEGTYYFAGGFYGGVREEFLRIAATNAAHIQQDLQCNIIALWHDESHLNRYFIDHKPTIILSPSYCYPGNRYIPFEPRLVALDKNHAEVRA